MMAWLRQCWAPEHRLALSLWLIGLLVCTGIIARSQFTADLSAFLPKAPTAEQRLLVDQLRDGLVSRLMLIGIEGGDAKQRAALSKAFAQTLRNEAAPLFTTVSNGELKGQEKDRELLFSRRYLLSPAVNTNLFSEAGLKQSLSETIDLIASPAGMMVKSLLPRDPTGEIPRLIDQFAGGQGPASQDGVWVSRDGQQALLLAQTKASGSDTDAQAQAVAALNVAFAKAQQQVVASNPTASSASKLVLSGPGVFAVQARTTIQSEVTRLSSMGMAFILILLLVVYRSFPALALGMLPVVSGALAGVAAVSLGFGTVHGITLGFGTTLIGEAVDYSIYLFVQSQRSTAVSDRAAWIRRFWPTIRLGVLTSIVGFLSLLVSGFPGLAQLGLYSIAGLITAAAVTRFVLPALLPTQFQVRDVAPLGNWFLQRLTQLQGRKQWGRNAVLACLVISAVVVALRHQQLWNRELSGLSPISAQDQALDAKMRGDLGAPDVRYLVAVSAPDMEGALRAAEQVATPLQALIDQNQLASFDSPARYLPSQATQQARLAALPDDATLQQQMRAASKELPVQASLFAPFYADVAQARQQPLLQRADLQGTSMGLALDGLLVQQTTATAEAAATTRWTALLPLRLPAALIHDAAGSAAAMQAVRTAVAQQHSSALFIDLKGESDAIYAGYLQEASLLSLAGLLGIVVLLAWSLRNVAAVLRVLLPLIAAVLVVMATLTLAGYTLTILHLVGLLLIVAVGSNYALFFEHRPEGGAHQGIEPRTLASLVLANLTTVAGFGLLAFSSVPVLQAMGMTVGPGAILALLFSALLAQPATDATSSISVPQ